MRKRQHTIRRLRRPLLESLEGRTLLHAGMTGAGLLGTYFDNKDFTNPKLQRVDRQVNFAWGYGSPDASIAPDTFAVRWSGQIVPDFTESYTFSTSTDDGVRVWINNKLVIDKLVNQPLTSYTSAKIPLVAGQAADIRVDYFDNSGQATAKLMWASPSTPKEIIPTEHLFPAPPPPPPPPPPPTTLRIDAAGTKPYTDADGKLWVADKYYSGGSTSLGLFDIDGTTDDTMYATRRFGKAFSYGIPVTPGDYKLNLLFADASYDAGGRAFNVSAEGTKILSNFDIVKSAGKGVALTESFNLTVTDGTLNLSFAGVVNNATLSAIEIIPANVAGPSITWQTKAPSPVVRAEALGGVVNDKLYVLGGFMNDPVTNAIVAQTRCDVYDPTTDTWTQLADEPEAITHAGIVIDPAGTIWLVGGYAGNHPGAGTTHVWKYDTTTNTWSSGPDLPIARGAGAAALLDGKIHFFGGMDETRDTDEGDHWAFDLNNPDAGWVTLASLPNPRNHVAAAAVGGKLYAIGGQHSQESSQDSQSEVDCYDPTTDTWTQVASLPAPRSHINASTFVMNDKIIVLGGEIAYNSPQNTVYQYDPTLNTWTLLGTIPSPRSTSVAGVIGPNQIISATGNSPYPTVDTWIGTLPT